MTEKLLLLYTAMRDERTPWYAKAILLLLVAYILSPIDIIPDFIPVIGLLDEAIIVPVTLAIVYRLIPEVVKREQQVQKIDTAEKRRLVLIGLALVASVWLLIIAATVYFYSVW